jgi:hypothetical protein
MVPIHPGRILRRELQARRLSANALARALRVPSGRIVSSTANARSPPRPHCASAVISATLRNSGSICWRSTISPLQCAMSADLWRAKSTQPHDAMGPPPFIDLSSARRSPLVQCAVTSRRGSEAERQRWVFGGSAVTQRAPGVAENRHRDLARFARVLEAMMAPPWHQHNATRPPQALE